MNLYAFFSTETRPGAFFRKVDWSSFWTATIVSFLVYFVTLGPSVTLEDCGELAVAGDWLGVPHPPGYPIWTICAYLFARAFSWVTYQGQPTPAWAISLMSSVFGALAAGFTAMLITRSAADLMRRRDEANSEPPAVSLAGSATDGVLSDIRLPEVFCWVGGVAGSLCFAFSPVMWSQSTIVEVYSLNAFFLMWIFLLTYRWMRKPGDKILWLTAFVFGLGLTNYQVLLLAMLPLLVVVFLRDITLFRDFLLIGIPILLSAHLLQIGAMPPATSDMQSAAYAKLAPILKCSVPSTAFLVVGAALAFAGLLVAMGVRFRFAPIVKLLRDDDGEKGSGVVLGLMLAGAGAVALSLLFSREAAVSPNDAPLTSPAVYVWTAALLLGVLAFSVAGALRLPAPEAERQGKDKWVNDLKGEKRQVANYHLFAAIAIALALLVVLSPVDKAVMPQGYQGEGFGWGFPSFVLLGGVAVLFLLAYTVPRGLFFAVPVAAVQISLFVLLKKGAMNGLTHPCTWWFWWPVLWNFVLILLAWMFLPHGRNVALTTFFAELGASFYVYMPIVSDLRNPPMNWGYPRTWEGFKHAITRGQYEKISPSDIFGGRMLKQLGFYFTDLRVQYTLIAATLGFLPFTLWSFRWKRAKPEGGVPAELGEPDAKRPSAGLVSLAASAALLVATAVVAESFPQLRWSVPVLFLLHFATLVFGLARLATNHRVKGVYVASVLYLLVSALVLVSEFVGGEPFLRLDKFLIGDIFLILFIGGVTIVGQQLGAFARRTWEGRNVSEGLTVGVSLAGLAAGACIFTAKVILHFLTLRAQELAKLNNTVYEPGMLLKFGVLLLAMLLVAGLCYGWYHLNRFAEKRFEFRYDADNVMQQWLIATAAGFFVMSVVLVVLANVKGDIQDAFIQKVKFISSHGLFAIWIGYGLVFGLFIANRVLGRLAAQLDLPKKFFRAGLVCCALLAAGIPVYENYYNKWIAFALGGAEQNGHDFGWQFGNYQLRGAKAITEELDADEEPLPNPLYPKEMGPGAIFFGGTDPGRFVPTYMIYSADVRPDVFLITQNALADNTYMSVMRDLYGNDIWIPSPEDSASAFQVYVDEVQSGKRPKNAALTIEGGRVQVSGALGVMEINGILCDMIFKKNKNLHEFYIEESYVIQWMYPYLTPNGLIMQINAEKTQIAPEVRLCDMDFWDWYSRKLVKNPMFRRDVPAQKSFSKLRSAIAGLYAARGMSREAEVAFQEARALYPVSPEANFRLIQEVLLPQARYAEAEDILTDFCKRDPNNERGPSFLEFTRKVQKSQEVVSRLRAKALGGNQKLSFAEMYSLSLAYRNLGNNSEAARLMKQMASLPGMPPAKVMELAFATFDMGKGKEAAEILDLADGKLPLDTLDADSLWKITQIYGDGGHLDKVAPALTRYLGKRGTDWRAWLNMAVVYASNGQSQETEYAIGNAIRFGSTAALEAIRQNPELLRLALPALRKLQKQRQAGGGLQLPLGPRVQ